MLLHRVTLHQEDRPLSIKRNKVDNNFHGSQFKRIHFSTASRQSAPVHAKGWRSGPNASLACSLGSQAEASSEHQVRTIWQARAMTTVVPVTALSRGTSSQAGGSSSPCALPVPRSAFAARRWFPLGRHSLSLEHFRPFLGEQAALHGLLPVVKYSRRSIACKAYRT